MTRDVKDLIAIVIFVEAAIFMPSPYGIPFALAALFVNVRILLRYCYVKIWRWEFGRMDLRA